MQIARTHLRTCLPALAFALIVLAFNAHWFRVPIIESSDQAANSIQVYHARMFREMLGNYSRWHFNHPGPFVFYCFAAGEALFHDRLGIVPGTMNAQMLTLVLLNAAWLFGAIEIFAAHTEGALFRPLALAMALLVIYNINHPNRAAALVNAWPPYEALFAFLFFAAACASVAAGRAGHLPLLALGAMTMVHLHVAQVLFAGVMAPAACAALAVGWLRGRKLLGELRRHAGVLVLSAGILALFLLPIVLEFALHTPNNVDYVRAYLQAYPNPNRGLAVAWPYLLSFLTFSKDVDLVRPPGGLVTQALSTPAVVLFWALFTGGAGASLALAKRYPKLISRFTAVVAVEGFVVSALFLCWANRITGNMYNFNGFFFYSIHLLGLFPIAGIVSAWQSKLHPRFGRRVLAAWAVPFLAMAGMGGELRNPDTGNPPIKTMSDELRGPETVQLVFLHDDWPTAVGVANQLARQGQAFCIASDWGFMFGYGHVCRPEAATRKVTITATAWYELGRQPLKLPVIIEMDELNTRLDGFYESVHTAEGDYRWSRSDAGVTFGLDRDGGAASYAVTLTGSVLPERAVEVVLNGHRLGVAEGIWKSSASFPAGRELMRPGGVNRLTFHTAGAGPIAGDSRDLGFSLMSVRIEAMGRR